MCKAGAKCRDTREHQLLCRYGISCRTKDNCHFLHTKMCLQGSKCSTKGCSYLHVSSTVIDYQVNLPCKYGTKCRNRLQHAMLCWNGSACSTTNCHYFHPVLCRYKSECRNKSCNFWHVI